MDIPTVAVVVSTTAVVIVLVASVVAVAVSASLLSVAVFESVVDGTEMIVVEDSESVVEAMEPKVHM